MGDQTDTPTERLLKQLLVELKNVRIELAAANNIRLAALTPDQRFVAESENKSLV